MKRRVLIALVLLLLLALLVVGILYASRPSHTNPNLTPIVTPTRVIPTVTPTHPATPIVTPENGNG